LLVLLVIMPQHILVWVFVYFPILPLQQSMLWKNLVLLVLVFSDWDVHHGNGTASCFQKDQRVRFVSLHQFPFYPMTGAPEERGPLGNLLNITFPSGAKGSEFIHRLCNEAIPFLTQHQPEIVFVSAGYDALNADPLGGLCLETEDYYEMTRAVMSSFGHKRIVFGLEGGYHVEETAKAIEKTLQGILEG
jgi:acetoin utilization deacetylase AcuC-like enzyme